MKLTKKERIGFRSQPCIFAPLSENDMCIDVKTTTSTSREHTEQRQFLFPGREAGKSGSLTSAVKKTAHLVTSQLRDCASQLNR
eukprot:733656-Rhodomonas_salina.2